MGRLARWGSGMKWKGNEGLRGARKNHEQQRHAGTGGRLPEEGRTWEQRQACPAGENVEGWVPLAGAKPPQLKASTAWVER